jgi:hypothetical protein
MRLWGLTTKSWRTFCLAFIILKEFVGLVLEHVDTYELILVLHFDNSCRGWKDLVDEWVKSAGDVAAAAMAGKLKCFVRSNFVD